MRIVEAVLNGALLLENKRFEDSRGFFMESYNHAHFTELTGWDGHFVQDNHSRSNHNVLRGMHYQLEQPQAKLVRVTAGRVYDVIVDLRQSSPTFKQSYGTYLSAENGYSLWIPEGFAHGFLVTSQQADLTYKVNRYYHPKGERCLHWADPEIEMSWPLTDNQPPSLSDKDQQGLPWQALDLFS
ncbi:dTDP-4-dehydrorhamnose 3,5-epimerase [Magnetococcus sp. PR-3]|uniref:dTDP-4-dehydrorhamnose 3,5-epimerase n=1 Tax=Magnetococcus sp. PR-3 TaxID=3120355 RepID=UPI002FCDF700